MRRQRDVDAIVDVRPFGVMVRLLGQQRYARHEGEGLREGAEPEVARNGEAVAAQRPVGKLGERGIAFDIGKTGNRHDFRLLGSFRAFPYRTRPCKPAASPPTTWPAGGA